MAYLEYFPESRLQLAQEVKKHPDLMEKIQKHPQDEFELILAEIATYCEILLDGYYTQEDLDGLCEILYWKLRNKRSPVIIVKN